MFEEIADAGLKTFAPYTVNPMAIDLYTVGQDPVKRAMQLESFPLQGRLIGIHTRLGAVPLNNWSCACYLSEIGNTLARRRSRGSRSTRRARTSRTCSRGEQTERRVPTPATPSSWAEI